MALHHSYHIGGGKVTDITNDVTLNTEQFTFLYVKCTQIDNLINVQGRATANSSITSAINIMSGLPFPSDASSYDDIILITGTASSNYNNGNYVHITAFFQQSSVTFLRLYPSQTISSGGAINFNITYTI